MTPLLHRRRIWSVIAQVAIAGVLGVLIFTPKIEADRADMPNTDQASDETIVGASADLLLPISEHRK